jgi:hypothetical protein
MSTPISINSEQVTMNNFIKMIKKNILSVIPNLFRDLISKNRGILEMLKQVQHDTATLGTILLLGALLLTSGCKKDDGNTYGVNNENLLPPGAGKTKVKSNEQYVSILYANLFQQALRANSLYDISKCIESIGDKDVAKEVIISNFMNKPNVQLPADSTMRNDVPKFVVDTYNRFLVRNPTEAEKTWFVNFINANPNVTPELVYFSFALCNEYQYY